MTYTGGPDDLEDVIDERVARVADAMADELDPVKRFLTNTGLRPLFDTAVADVVVHDNVLLWKLRNIYALPVPVGGHRRWVLDV